MKQQPHKIHYVTPTGTGIHIKTICNRYQVEFVTEKEVEVTCKDCLKVLSKQKDERSFEQRINQLEHEVHQLTQHVELLLQNTRELDTRTHGQIVIGG